MQISKTDILKDFENCIVKDVLNSGNSVVLRIEHGSAFTRETIIFKRIPVGRDEDPADENSIQNAKKEFEIMKSLSQHTSVVRPFASEFSQDSKVFEMIMEDWHESLSAQKKNHPDAEVIISWFTQCVDVLA
jgi:hypothetical protein